MNKKKFLKLTNPLILKGIAHRGLHNDVAPENSMAAFSRAIDADFAFEFDVHLTKDGSLLVVHDENLLRTTKKAGIVEDLDLDFIQKNYRLADGSGIPTLDAVLNLCQERVPVVIELKVYRKNYRKLARAVVSKLKAVKDKKNFMLISFDPRALFYAKKAGILNSLLLTSSRKDVCKFRFLFNSVDVDQAMLADKRIVKYRKKHFVNVWTIKNIAELEKIKGKADTFTFENIPAAEIASRFL